MADNLITVPCASAALERIRAGIAGDRCDGDTEYARGVNDACRNHLQFVERVIADVAGAKEDGRADERAAFEAWFLDYCGTGPEGAVFDQASTGWLKRREDGHYEETRVRDAWLGWQGRAARAAIDNARDVEGRKP